MGDVEVVSPRTRNSFASRPPRSGQRRAEAFLGPQRDQARRGQANRYKSRTRKPPEDRPRATKVAAGPTCRVPSRLLPHDAKKIYPTMQEERCARNPHCQWANVEEFVSEAGGGIPRGVVETRRWSTPDAASCDDQEPTSRVSAVDENTGHLAVAGIAAHHDVGVAALLEVWIEDRFCRLCSLPLCAPWRISYSPLAHMIMCRTKPLKSHTERVRPQFLSLRQGDFGRQVSLPANQAAEGQEFRPFWQIAVDLCFLSTLSLQAAGRRSWSCARAAPVKMA